MASPIPVRTKSTRKRLEKCWSTNLNWDLYPDLLKSSCWQIGKALSVPPESVLGGLLAITNFVLSPAQVKVPTTSWVEPGVIWLTISMPTGSRKTTVDQFLRSLLQDIRNTAGCADTDEEWLLQDATFEKMGVLMADNCGRLLGLYDEMSSFLTKIKLYSSRGLNDSHELAMFLELYNGNSWTRTTVTGEANFSMANTSLTLGGFNQPAVARTLIELPGNSEKGLSQRFLWMFPKPIYGQFSTLEPVDESFRCVIVQKLSACFMEKAYIRTEVRHKKFQFTSRHDSFTTKYDSVQKQLGELAVMDDLMSVCTVMLLYGTP
jgi:hypothetical protein